ncbi:hypothetical protein [Nocardioides sp. R-C-SC26]|uniref:hypothetical protein n=1 Tax=Nocardioides sp. R-C-SC26 TaxID=2870414 RepID=UPI001E2FB632|nr:hypothetical protein [Nocardioides sp. R-C-SC26]
MAGETKTLLALLRTKYVGKEQSEEYAGGVFLEECGINGGGASSRCDALYVGFTSASGRLLVGHEVKVSRADWRRELAKVGKADFWHDNTHQWWIVAPGPEVVPAEELPEGWGLLYPGGRGLRVVVKAHTRDVVPGWTAVRSVMARLDTLQRQQMLDFRRDVRDQLHRGSEQRIAAEVERRAGGRVLTSSHEQRLDMLARIESAFGVEMANYFTDGDHQATPEELAAALTVVRGARTATGRWRSLYADELRDTATRFLEALTDFDAARQALVDISGERRR